MADQKTFERVCDVIRETAGLAKQQTSSLRISALLTA